MIIVIEGDVDCLKVGVTIISFEEVEHLLLDKLHSLETLVLGLLVEHVL